MDTALVGVGLYSVQEAARLLGAPTYEVRRWMFGYHYRKESGAARKIPSVAGSHLVLNDTQALTFFDLLELRLIKALRGYQITLQAIRRAVLEARDILGSPHPFALKKIQTDGRRIFASAAAQAGDDHLIDLVSRQFVLRKVIADSLIAGVDFDDAGVAQRWFPPAGGKKVVLDPERSFGKPILVEHGFPTWVLLEAYKAEGEDAGRVARIYGVPRPAVNAAVRFERNLH